MDMVNSDIGCTLVVRETQPRMGAGKITFHLALETARHEPLTILGDLVHNETVLTELREKGIRFSQSAAEIATQTGGRAFAAALTSDLPSVAARIAVELRNQYVLGYYPQNQTRNGEYRKVEVKIAQPKGVSQLKGHWRLGYYAPSQ